MFEQKIEIISRPNLKMSSNKKFVYDCFMFFNEFDILDLRLNILDSVVDVFVLVESSVTSKGELKDLFYKTNRNRYAKFENKIIHIVYNPFERYPGGDFSCSKWFFENTQRDAIMLGLEHCRDDDVVLISDVDEIPDPQAILMYKDVEGVKVFQQQLMYYYVNLACWTNPSWPGTRMGNYADLLDPKQDLYPKEYFAFSSKGKPTYFRFCQGLNIYEAGWHFSYCGGYESIRVKKRAIVDGYDHSGDLSEKDIGKIIRKCRDIHGRNIFFKIVSPNLLPQYLIDNEDKYRSIILRLNFIDYFFYLCNHFQNIIVFYAKKIYIKFI